MTDVTGTVRLHRILAAPPEKVFRAFVDPDGLAKWLPPDGFTATVHHMEPREGGTFRMSFTNFTTGVPHSFGGTYLELVPAQRLRYTDTFDDPNLPGEMTTVIELKPVSTGTDISIEQSGIPAAIPVEACVMGWQQSLQNLAKLVEPDIRG